MHGNRAGWAGARITTLAIAIAIAAPAWAQGPNFAGPAPATDVSSPAEAPEALPLAGAQPTGVSPSTDTGVSAGARVELSPIDTIVESLFGDVYAEGRWRPVSLGTFFTEGWFEPWASGPAGQSGLTPRHGWLGSFEGVFYRLWLTGLTYQTPLAKPFGGQGYSGSYTIFLPFSKRFEFAMAIPYVVSTGTKDSTRGYRADFGDMVLGTRFMLSETAATTQTFNLDIRVPTGRAETFGHLMALTPRYEFWTNPIGPWVFRGGAGISIPLNKNDLRPFPVVAPDGTLGFGESTAQTAFVGDLAIGRYFRPHDVLFGDLVLYVAANVITPLEDRGRYTYFGMGPGTRFHITDNWFFLHNWEFPLVGPTPYNFQMQVAIMKVF